MLLSNPGFTLGLVFLIGVVLYAIGVALPGRIQAPPAPWPLRLDDCAVGLDSEAKIGLIERLGLVGLPWCEEILMQADTEENEPAVRRAITLALSECKQPR